MKKILLSLLLSAPVAVVFSQTPPPSTPCPISYKSNLGGGPQCGKQGGLSATAKIIFEYSTQPTCAPTILGVLDKNGHSFTNNVDYILGPGVVSSNNNGTFSVEYCLYGEPSNNFFNQKDLLFTLQYNCPGYDVTTIFCNSEGIVTPVKFSSFTATRSNSSVVSINWTTAQEDNSKGFNVQKYVNGEWKTIAFVFSQSVNGTSTSPLSYSYTDQNSEKGVTQYRIQQVDLDGKFAYSDIRAIRGDGSLSKLVVYPNPSTDGKVNVVFEDNLGVRDVQVSDMQGKVIKSFKGITNNILVIEKLTTGFYTIKVSNRTTSASSVQKVVVK